MFVGIDEAGKTYTDYTENNKEMVTINQEGFGDFMVGAESISVWMEKGINI